MAKMTDVEIADTLAKVSDFKEAFGTPAGRKVLRYMMQRTGILRTTFVAGDPYTSAYNEGQRAFMLLVLEQLKVDIKKLEKELYEAKEESDVILD